MLIIDFSSVMIGKTIFLANQSGERIDRNLMRHVVVMTFGELLKEFPKHSKHTIVAFDSKGQYWRKDLFPYYKQNRKKTREKSDIDWEDFYREFSIIKSEFIKTFPYYMIDLPKVEADDIIGTLCLTYEDDTVIVSTDKDMIQLMDGKRVKIFDPKTMEYRSRGDYDQLAHIVRGDSGDGIPNILSDDDTLVCEGKRQSPISASMIEKISTIGIDGFLEEYKPKSKIKTSRGGTKEEKEEEKRPIEEEAQEQKRLIKERYHRNRSLIDQTAIPDHIKNEILKEVSKQITREDVPTREDLARYMRTHKMRIALSDLDSFIPSR